MGLYKFADTIQYRAYGSLEFFAKQLYALTLLEQQEALIKTTARAREDPVILLDSHQSVCSMKEHCIVHLLHHINMYSGQTAVI